MFSSINNYNDDTFTVNLNIKLNLLISKISNDDKNKSEQKLEDDNDWLTYNKLIWVTLI
jgi:hypothetical protein